MIERERDSETLFLLKANQDPASYRIVVISFQFCSRGTLPLLTTSLGRQDNGWAMLVYRQISTMAIPGTGPFNYFFLTSQKFRTEGQRDIRALLKNTMKFFIVFAKHYEFFKSVSKYYEFFHCVCVFFLHVITK